MNKDDEERSNKRFADAMLAVAAITNKHGKERGVIGAIECPVCKGTLRYSIARANGHIHAACQTKDCLRWIQ